MNLQSLCVALYCVIILPQTHAIQPKVLEEIENNLTYIRSQTPSIKKIILKTHPFIDAHLTKGFFSIRRNWAKKYGCRLEIKSVQSFSFLEYRFVDISGSDILV